MHSCMHQTCRYDLLCRETICTAQIFEMGKIPLSGDSHEMVRHSPATALEDLDSSASKTPQLWAGSGISGLSKRVTK